VIQTITEQQIAPFLQATNKKDALRELVALMGTTCKNTSEEELYRILLEREGIGTTGIGEGIAIPHGKLSTINQIKICFGRSIEGVAFDAIDGKPVHLFFLLLAPSQSAGPYLNTLAKLARFLKSPRIRSRLLHAASAREILNIFSNASEFN